MLKKIILAASILLAAGCVSTQDKKEIPKVEKTVIEKSEIVSFAAEPDYGKIRFKWQAEDNKNIEKFILNIKEESGFSKNEELGKEIDSYEIESKPLKNVRATIKIKYFDGTYSKGKTIKAFSKLGAKIIREDEYIDIDSNTVKFLFKTNKGAKVELYCGEDKDNMKLLKTEENYDFQKNGLKAGGFEVGKTYFYKIVSEYEGKKIESTVQSFTKKEIKEDEKVAEWSRKAVFYEIFVRSFADGNGDGIGDFKGITENLDYLKEMGIDAVWLMPTCDSSTYHGYNINDYYAVEPDYGTMEEFEEMIKKAHEKGIKIIIDFVVNHTGTEVEWFKEARKSNDNPYRNYYYWADEFDDVDENGTWGQSIWYQMDNENWYMAIFWSGMPDLNFRNNNVREDIIKAAEYWLDKGVDGFRLDASKHIDDKDKEATLAWWKNFRDRVKDKNPDAFIVGENWDSSVSYIAPFFDVMDSSFNFGLSYEIIDTAKGNQKDLINMLNAQNKVYKKYSEKFVDTTFLRNHDMERTATELKGDIKRQKLAAAILMTLPGTPFIYYGEELGQKGSKPDGNIREPFDWYKSGQGKYMVDMTKSDYGDRMRFTNPDDGISLEEQKDDESSLYNYFRKLIKIRKENPVFFGGEYTDIGAPKGVIAYTVKDENSEFLVYHYTGEGEITIGTKTTAGMTDILNGRKIEGNELTLTKGESLIFKLR